ncbi:DUF1330 domain-containing protein [Cohaesibacter haloalkalitolerans]|uniref:DUF1330 domain-containing protein n=1 Tax=Cohaesibacter haloalkalitolerans TaxID=1162980 RepID=UPI0013C4E47A|nr:DUF1330 domain-containing protein [Cohaesibacter haloalkalitolerans]
MSTPAYFVLEIAIHDEERLKPYLENVGATIASYAVEALANGGQVVPLEGAEPNGKVVMLKFSSMEEARSWYASPAYQEILRHRLAAADNRSYFVEGL